jgi:hypothetical protein
MNDEQIAKEISHHNLHIGEAILHHRSGNAQKSDPRQGCANHSKGN